jgi:uncharacterized alpha-E superfamily protein
MLLSRVAENIYWMGRYLERAENVARLINSTTTALLDLPRGVQLGWDRLVQIIGGEKPAAECIEQLDERSVMRFLISESRHPSSIISCIKCARTNGRTTREIISQEVWEQVNALYLFASEQAAASLGRRKRFDFLNAVIVHCQTINGALAGTSIHDSAYQFLRLGRNLERADMTSRIIDVPALGLVPDEDAAGGNPAYASVRWMSVLKSLSAYQTYRYRVHVNVRGPAVLGYLLHEQVFPRSVAHCLGAIGACLAELPNPEPPQRVLGRVQRFVHDADTDKLAESGLHEFVDELQKGLEGLHGAVSEGYFRLNQSAA